MVGVVSGDRTVALEGGVAFVGSTLPAAILSGQIRSGEVKRVYVSHPKFLESYKILTEVTGVHIDIEDVSSESRIKRFTKLLKIVLHNKIKNNLIFIYHECCWPLLDLLVWLIRPRGVFMPQSDITFMYKPVENLKVFFQHMSVIHAMKNTILSLFFKYRSFENDTKDGVMFLPTVRRYPLSIKTVIRTEISSRGKTVTPPNKKLLIFSGSDCASSQEMIEIYKKIVSEAHSQGYKVAVKDHPNINVRLNLVIDGVETLNPAIPAEILEDNYTLVVGTASAAMATYGNRAASICRLLNSMGVEDKELRIKYLLSINPQARIINEIGELFL